MGQLSGVSTLLLIVFCLFVMQAIGGYFQIKDYRKSVKRVHKLGNVGIGQKRGKLRNSVSLLTLVRVLHPQVGHNIHSKPLPLIGIPALFGEPPILIQQNIKFILNQSVFRAVQI